MTPTDTLAKFRAATMLVYAAAISIVLIKAGEPEKLWWWVAALPFFLWVVAPILAPLTWRGCGRILAVGMSLIAAASLWIYWQGMFGPDPSSTSALIFIFLPIYQWLAVALLAGLAHLVRRWRPK